MIFAVLTTAVAVANAFIQNYNETIYPCNETGHNSTNCPSFTISWNGSAFEMFLQQGAGNPGGYFAVGFSKVHAMQDADLYYCDSSGLGTGVIGKRNYPPRLLNISDFDGIKVISISNSDGIARCHFTRAENIVKNVSTGPMSFNINNGSYYVLFAWGNMSTDGNLKYHGENKTIRPLNFASKSQMSSSYTSSPFPTDTSPLSSTFSSDIIATTGPSGTKQPTEMVSEYETSTQAFAFSTNATTTVTSGTNQPIEMASGYAETSPQVNTLSANATTLTVTSGTKQTAAKTSAYVKTSAQTSTFSSDASTATVASGTKQSTSITSESSLTACTGRQIKSLKVNISFYFPTTKVGALQRSNETCANSDYTATIVCADGRTNGGIMFNTSTLKEFSCNSNGSALLNEIEQGNITSDSLTTYISTAYTLSTKPNASESGITSNVVKVLDALQKQTSAKNITVTQESMTGFVWISNNLFNSEMDVKSLRENEKSIIVKSQEVFVLNLQFESTELILDSESAVILKAKKINCSESRKASILLNTEASSANVNATLPTSEMFRECGQRIVTSQLLHRSGILFPKPKINNTKTGQVYGLNIQRLVIRNLTQPINFSFSEVLDAQSIQSIASKKIIQYLRCSYYDVASEDWKFDGCEATTTKDNKIKCACDHLTSFAVLVQTRHLLKDYALELVGKIGCSLSVIGLSLMIIIFISNKKLRMNQINQIHINLSLCLLISLLIFLTGVDKRFTTGHNSCLTIAFSLQFFLLSAWGWMTAECFTMHKKFVRVFSHTSKFYAIRVAAIVYSAALVTSIITIIAAVFGGKDNNWKPSPRNGLQRSAYISDRMCWLHGYSLYFGFLMPVGIMLVVNIVGSVRIIQVFLSMNEQMPRNSADQQNAKDTAFRIIVVSLLLGLSWAFAIPLTVTDDVTTNSVFGWLFSITSAFQGLFIFFIFCVKPKDIRDIWMKKLSQLCSGSDYSSGRNADASSPTATLSQTGQTTLNVLNESADADTAVVNREEKVDIDRIEEGSHNNKISETALQSANEKDQDTEIKDSDKKTDNKSSEEKKDGESKVKADVKKSEEALDSNKIIEKVEESQNEKHGETSGELEVKVDIEIGEEVSEKTKTTQLPVESTKNSDEKNNDDAEDAKVNNSEAEVGVAVTENIKCDETELKVDIHIREEVSDNSKTTQLPVESTNENSDDKNKHDGKVDSSEAKVAVTVTENIKRDETEVKVDIHLTEEVSDSSKVIELPAESTNEKTGDTSDEKSQDARDENSETQTVVAVAVAEQLLNNCNIQEIISKSAKEDLEDSKVAESEVKPDTGNDEDIRVEKPKAAVRINKANWNTKSIAEHENRIEVYSSAALSLLSRFNDLVDKPDECDPTIVAKTYESLTSALRVWGDCLEQFIVENHSSEMAQIVELLEKSKVQLETIKDNESSIHMRYRIYQGGPATDEAPTPAATGTENSPPSPSGEIVPPTDIQSSDKSQDEIEDKKTAAKVELKDNEDGLNDSDIAESSAGWSIVYDANSSTKSIAEHEANIEAHSAAALSLLNKFNALVDKADAADQAEVAQIYGSLATALATWRDCLKEFIKGHQDTEVKQIAELSQKSKNDLALIKDNESLIKMRYRRYEGSCITEGSDTTSSSSSSSSESGSDAESTPTRSERPPSPTHLKASNENWKDAKVTKSEVKVDVNRDTEESNSSGVTESGWSIMKLDPNWSTKAIAEHETHIDVYSSTSLSLLNRFNELVDTADGKDQAEVAEIYDSLTSALRVWRGCLEAFIKEHRNSEVKQLSELSDKSKPQLAQVKDNERTIKMRYRLYQGACAEEPSTQPAKPSSSAPYQRLAEARLLDLEAEERMLEAQARLEINLAKIQKEKAKIKGEQIGGASDSSTSLDAPSSLQTVGNNEKSSVDAKSLDENKE